MKTAIISDLHANIEALTVVLRHIEEQGITDIVCLGDVIGYGPNPREALTACRNVRFCLMGNHEEAVLFYGEDFNPKARAALEPRRMLLIPIRAPAPLTARPPWSRSRVGEDGRRRIVSYGGLLVRSKSHCTASLAWRKGQA